MKIYVKIDPDTHERVAPEDYEQWKKDHEKKKKEK